MITRVSSASKTVEIERGGRTVIIGERINPTGRKRLTAELESGNLDLVVEEARAQESEGADIIDVNIGVYGVNQRRLLPEAIKLIQGVTALPLCIDCQFPDAVEAALAVYRGKALVNSVNGQESLLESILPIVKRHGAAVIGLCMDEQGILSEPEGRLRVAHKILDRAAIEGIPTEDVIIDPLVLTVGTDSQAGWVCLQTIELLVRELGVNVTCGASAASFGLPNRPAINNAFLAMAIAKGVNAPIVNPAAPGLMQTLLAAELLMGRDDFAMRYIAHFRKAAQQPAQERG